MKKEDLEKLSKEDLIKILLKMEEENKELKEKAIKDNLTGLNNRASFDNHMEIQMGLTKRNPADRDLSIIVIDLDKFKNVNDTYGHQMGDVVLKEAAKCIKHSSRISDIACRFGGEEMVLILPETSLKGANVVAEKIRKRLEERVYSTEDGIDFKVTGSFGVSSYEEGDTVESLFERADKALYSAKGNGRNAIYYNEEGVINKYVKVKPFISSNLDMVFEDFEEKTKNIVANKEKEKRLRKKSFRNH